MLPGLGTAVAKEAWLEASAEEAEWAQELQRVRAEIKVAEAEEAEKTALSGPPKRELANPIADSGSSRAQSQAMHRHVPPSHVAPAIPASRDEAAEAGIKWSDVGTPAEVLEKKLRKYRAKMNSPELTAAKRHEYLGKIRHYSAKAAELKLESGGPRAGAAGTSRGAGTGSSGATDRTRLSPSGVDGAERDATPSAVSKRAGQKRGHSVRGKRSTAVNSGESNGWTVGDRCHAGTLLGTGTVRFVGQCLELTKDKGSRTGTAPPLWAGVELDHPRGKHDGYAIFLVRSCHCSRCAGWPQ